MKAQPPSGRAAPAARAPPARPTTRAHPIQLAGCRVAVVDRTEGKDMTYSLPLLCDDGRSRTSLRRIKIPVATSRTGASRRRRFPIPARARSGTG